MRPVKCILIDPPDETSSSDYNGGTGPSTEMHEVYPSLGLLYIAGVLRKNGIDVSVIEARTTGLTYDEVISRVEEEKPDFAGITVITSKVAGALRLSAGIKEADQNIKVILGGPHIHFEHRTVIEDPSVDFCVRGEGEITAFHLITCISNGGNPGNIRGVTFKRGKDVVVNPDRPFIHDLDDIPFPTRDLLHDPVYRGAWTEDQAFLPMIATRGCPYHCQFCASPAIWGHLQRRRSVRNVLEEIGYLNKKFNVRCIRFLDDLLVANKRWAIDLCRGMIEEGLDDIVWACDCRVGLMSEELLAELKRANCQIIFYGIEFGNQRILDLSQKGFTLDQVRKTIEMTSKAGVSAYGYFMMGYPTETEETIEDTINFALELARDYGMDSAGFSIVTPFPGTGLYEYCKRNEMLKSSDWSRYSYQQGRSIIKLKNIRDVELEALYERALYQFQFREKIHQFV